MQFSNLCVFIFALLSAEFFGEHVAVLFKGLALVAGAAAVNAVHALWGVVLLPLYTASFAVQALCRVAQVLRIFSFGVLAGVGEVGLLVVDSVYVVLAECPSLLVVAVAFGCFVVDAVKLSERCKEQEKELRVKCAVQELLKEEITRQCVVKRQQDAEIAALNASLARARHEIQEQRAALGDVLLRNAQLREFNDATRFVLQW